MDDPGFSLIAALDGAGGASWRDDVHDVGAGPVWIHGHRESRAVLSWLEDAAGIPPVIVGALLDRTSRPRWTAHDHGLLLILRGVNLNPGADPADMISIRCWLTKDRLVSLHRERVAAVDDLRAEFEAGAGPKTTPALLIRLNRLLLSNMAPTIDRIAEQFDELEDRVLDPHRELDGDALSTLRRRVVDLSRYLVPQRDALVSLRDADDPLLEGEPAHELREVVNRVTRHVEELGAAKERGSILSEDNFQQLTERLNERMYALTLIAALFLPLGFITGLMGTNVGGIPGAGHRFGFAIEVVILLAIGVGTIAFFKMKRWL